MDAISWPHKYDPTPSPTTIERNMATLYDMTKSISIYPPVMVTVRIRPRTTRISTSALLEDSDEVNKGDSISSPREEELGSDKEDPLFFAIVALSHLFSNLAFVYKRNSYLKGC